MDQGDGGSDGDEGGDGSSATGNLKRKRLLAGRCGGLLFLCLREEEGRNVDLLS